MINNREWRKITLTRLWHKDRYDGLSTAHYHWQRNKEAKWTLMCQLLSVCAFLLFFHLFYRCFPAVISFLCLVCCSSFPWAFFLPSALKGHSNIKTQKVLFLNLHRPWFLKVSCTHKFILLTCLLSALETKVETQASLEIKTAAPVFCSVLFWLETAAF